MLSLLLGWPDWETVLLGQYTPHSPIPTQVGSGREPLRAANVHVVDNIRNCLLRTVPMEDCFSHVMCFEPWLPVNWTELKHVYMVIIDGHGQKVQLLLRWRGSYLRIWKKKLTSSSSSWWPHTICRHLVPARSWPQQYLQWAIPFGHPSAMHQERIGPGELSILADRHHQWLSGAHRSKVWSAECWTSRVPDPH